MTEASTSTTSTTETVVYAGHGVQLLRSLGPQSRSVTVVRLATDVPSQLRERLAAAVERTRHEPAVGTSYVTADLETPSPWAASVDEPGRDGVERVLPDLVGPHGAAQARDAIWSTRAGDRVYPTVAAIPTPRRRWQTLVAVLVGLVPSAILLAVAWSAGGGEEPATEPRQVEQNYEAPAPDAPPPAPFISGYR